MKTVCAIPGEDAAPEAFHPTVALIESLGLDLRFCYPPVGQAGLEGYGKAFPRQAREMIDASDATFFGATNGQSAAALFYLRWGKATYANVRPTRYLTGYKSPLASPEGLDLVIVRENLEDAYVCVEGDLEDGVVANLRSRTARKRLGELGKGRYAVKAITDKGAEQVARHACELARRRKSQGHPGKLTCGTKHNMLPHVDGLFRDVTARVAQDYPDVTFESFIVDDLAHRLVAQPQSLDVVLLPNLYGDILSDAAAGLAGGLGLAASGCYGNRYAYFESAHGSAPDIAGRGIINPTATILSGVMMLEHLGFSEAAARLHAALEATYAAGEALTPDQGGSASTQQFCDKVSTHL
ncbi:MAG: isocitrate/isopropylmalate family dehydrogenase [Myxococcales bacterium]|nr:isocitrate/isopropylmalate family dehydrogenase [Myxococcales bacterium]